MIMTRPTVRVLALLEILQLGGRHTVGDLAERLGVDERTVRRYAVHLADLGVPVRVHRGRYGGYELARGYRLPPLMLTDDEAVAVALGLTAGERLGLFAAASTATSSALAKVQRVLPSALARRVAAVLSSVEFTTAGPDGTATSADALLEIADAAEQRRTVAIDYASWGGERTRREVDVYGVVFHSARWYVTGYDHLTGEVRTFRLDRVGSVTRGDGTYDVPTGFDAPSRVLTGIASVGWRHEVVVQLHVSPDEARRRLPRSLGTLQPTPNGVRLTARVEHLDVMARILAGLGCRMTVERPDQLRTELAALASLLDQAARPAQRSRS